MSSQEHPILECGSVVCINTQMPFVYLGRVDYTGHRFVVLSECSCVDVYDRVESPDNPEMADIFRGKFQPFSSLGDRYRRRQHRLHRRRYRMAIRVASRRENQKNKNKRIAPVMNAAEVIVWIRKTESNQTRVSTEWIGPDSCLTATDDTLDDHLRRCTYRPHRHQQLDHRCWRAVVNRSRQ